jgi:uncharacterized protein DUF5677
MSHKENIRSLSDNVSFLLSEMKPVIDSSAKLAWQPSTGYRRVIFRAILIRQYECLESILHLVENERGYAGVSLLRPACEELIWGKYLTQLDEDAANELLLCMVSKEIFETLKAQDDHIGRTRTKELGLLHHFESATKAQPITRERLSCLGRKLKWTKRTVDAGMPPSTQFIARRTGMISIYNFLFHASSRYVHFSTSELLRRAWGKPQEITIRSSTFEDYWSVFALVWGLKLLTDTYLVLQENLTIDGVINPDIDGTKIISAYKEVAEFGFVPIITPEELNWNL